MEQDALAFKIHNRRQEVQADLNRKREVLEQVTERIRDLQEMSAAAAGEDDGDSSSTGEDLLAEIMATPSASTDSRSTDAPPPTNGIQDDDYDDDSHGWGEEGPVPEPGEPEPPALAMQESAKPVEVSLPNFGATEEPEDTTATSQTLRPRGRQPEDADAEKNTGRTTAAQLFEGRSVTTELSQTATTEAILDRQRAEQDALSESILKMASDLKASSKAFSASLDEDKDILGQASSGLEKNELGLEAAARRMGTLRKLTEGKGWLGRILLYAWIYGLMVALVLVVFVLPKLRF